MKNKNTIWFGSLIAILVTITTIISCNKKFDNPPAPTDPNITPTISIKALKALHTVSGAYDDITTDAIISGVVIADDRSGNIYKSLYIQDATGSLNILLDATGLNTSYPVGRKLFIKCKGLVLSDYNRMIQLGIKSVVNGSPSLEGIPSGLISNYVIGGSLGNVVAPKVVTVAQLGTSVNMQDEFLGSLIQLNNYEFLKGDTAKTFADTSSYKNSANLTIQDCSGSASSIIIRSSGFSNFAAAKPAKGNGTILAIYTAFGNTKQLVLRDTSDIKFTGTRCSIFEEDFEGATVASPVAITGWRNIGEVGGASYIAQSFSSNKYAQITAFGTTGNPPVVTSWLISPAISLAGLTTPVLTFGTTDGFNNGATLTTLVSTNYNPSSNTPSTATWVVLPATYAGPTVSGYASGFRASGNISLSAYAGQTVYIGFRYDGANPATGTRRTTTWQVDNVKVTRN